LVVVTTTLLFGAALAISDFTLSEICVSVGAVSVPAFVDGAVVAEGAVAEIEGCAGAPVEAAAAVSADETLGVKSVAAAPAALPASEASALTGGVASMTGAVLSMTGAFAPWPLVRVDFFFALIGGTGSSTAGEAGVAAGAAVGAGAGFRLGVPVDGVVAGLAAGSAESAIGGGADVSPAVAALVVAGGGASLDGAVAALMAASFATCRFACTANMEAPTAQRAARPNPTTTLLVMFACVSEYAMMKSLNWWMT
jgi:hypothetical protein